MKIYEVIYIPEPDEDSGLEDKAYSAYFALLKDAKSHFNKLHDDGTMVSKTLRSFELAKLPKRDLTIALLNQVGFIAKDSIKVILEVHREN